MKIQVSWLGWILFGCALIVIFFLRSCQLHPGTVTKTIPGDTKFVKGQTDTLWRKPEKVYVRQPGLIYTVIHEDTVYLPGKKLTHADTLEAAEKYFIATIILDTLKGQQVVVALRDSIGRNKILGRTFQVKNTRAIQQVVNTPAKNKIFFGGQAGLSLSLKSAIVSPSVMLLTKKDALYSISFDLISRTPMVGCFFKIHL